MLILPNKRLDFTCLRVALVLHWHAIQRHRSLWCFTGYYFIDDERSHALWRSSCAAVYTYFQLVFAIFGSACLMSFCRRCRSLWCFTGYDFIDETASCRFLGNIDRSGVSLATISLTRSAPMQRGARPARPSVALVLHWLLFH